MPGIDDGNDPSSAAEDALDQVTHLSSLIFRPFHWPTISALEFFVGEINNPKDILRKLTGWVVE
jgi:hypothetical protein